MNSMNKKKKEEEDAPALRIAKMQQFRDSKNLLKRARKETTFISIELN